VNYLTFSGAYQSEKGDPPGSWPEYLTLLVKGRKAPEVQYVPIRPHWEKFDYPSLENFSSDGLLAAKDFVLRTGRYPLRCHRFKDQTPKDPFREDWSWYEAHKEILNSLGRLTSVLWCNTTPDDKDHFIRNFEGVSLRPSEPESSPSWTSSVGEIIEAVFAALRIKNAEVMSQASKPCVIHNNEHWAPEEWFLHPGCPKCSILSEHCRIFSMPGSLLMEDRTAFNEARAFLMEEALRCTAPNKAKVLDLMAGSPWVDESDEEDEGDNFLGLFG
jgi:hypothetical protein